MKTRTSKEIREETVTLSKQIREKVSRIDITRTEMQAESWGSPRFFVLENEIEALKKEIPPLTEKHREAQKDLAMALKRELEELRIKHAEIRPALVETVAQVFKELSEATTLASEKLKAAAYPHLPEGSKLELVFSLEARECLVDRSPKDNALSIMLLPLTNLIHSKNCEIRSLQENLSR